MFEKVSRFADVDIEMPARKTACSAGYDFVVAEDIIVPPMESIMDEIEAIYGDDYYAQYDSWMFEDCSQEDFAEYIRKEYGVKHYERTILFVK